MNLGEQLPRQSSSGWRKGRRFVKRQRAKALRRLGRRSEERSLPTNRYHGWAD